MVSSHEERAQDMLPKLMNEHPALFAGRTFDIPSDLALGWYSIATQLCVDLEVILGDNAVNWQPLQSKEKFGSWRLYWRLHLGDQLEDGSSSSGVLTADIQVPSGTPAAGTFENTEVSATPAGYRITLLPKGELRRAVHARVREAELATEQTCMWCGERGMYWTTGWVHVACPKHRRRDAIPLAKWHKLQAIRREKYERGRGPKERKEDGGRDE